MNEFEQELAKDLNKEFGGNVAFLLEDGSPSDVDTWISTGSTLLDYIISNKENGGIPVGKVTEIAGMEGTGKTLLAMQICANAQRMGGHAVYIDMEHAFNSDFAMRVGLDVTKNFLYCKPRSLEDVFQFIFKICHKLDEKEKAKEPVPFMVLVWDSVASSPPQYFLDSENPDPTATMGLRARIISQNIYTLLGTTGRHRVAQVFLNQLRYNLAAGPFSDKFVTPGGAAIPFAASARVRIARRGMVKVKDTIVGIMVKAKVKKTRFGPGYRECEFPIYFTHGIDDREAIMSLLRKETCGVVSKAAGKHKHYYWLKGTDESTKLTHREFKMALKTDPKLKSAVHKVLADIMVKDMIDVENASYEVVADTL